MRVSVRLFLAVVLGSGSRLLLLVPCGVSAAFPLAVAFAPVAVAVAPVAAAVAPVAVEVALVAFEVALVAVAFARVAVVVGKFVESAPAPAVAALVVVVVAAVAHGRLVVVVLAASLVVVSVFPESVSSGRIGHLTQAENKQELHLLMLLHRC